MDARKILEEKYYEIDTIIQKVCQRKNITGESANDFRSYAFEKLAEKDCRRIREFRGKYKTSWGNYMNFVIVRLALDYIKKEWGRWEPSIKAKSLGELGVAFEVLIHREKRPVMEAIEFMLDNQRSYSFHQFKPEVLDLMKRDIPAQDLKKIKTLSGTEIYKRAKCDSLLKSILEVDSLPPYCDKLFKASEISLNRELLESWATNLIDRRPKTKVIKDADLKTSEEGRENSLLNNLPDLNSHDPHLSIEVRELDFDLERIIADIMGNLLDEDFAILKMYLIFDKKVSEIARVIKKEEQKSNISEEEQHKLFIRNRGYIQKRINTFMENLRKEIQPLHIAREEQGMVVKHCLRLVCEKFAEKEQ